MAYKGAWGTYIHIPKCGGWSMRKFLPQYLGAGHEAKPYHGLPETVERGFTLVRHPVDWIRSLWTYRNNLQWKFRGGHAAKASSYWHACIGLTQWAAGLPWADFVDQLCALDNDIVYVIYGMYRHPDVKIYQLEHVGELVADLGLDAEFPVTHVTTGKPTITDEQREKLERLCRRSIEDYGYADLTNHSS